MTFVQQNKEEFQQIVDHLKQDVSGLRTGRATPALVEDLSVEAYGTRQPLKTLASIIASDPKTLVIEPWDKSIVQAIDTGIRAAGMGFNPVNDGKIIRIPLPELTADRRAELIKILHQKLEAGKISARQLRESVKEMIDLAENEKEIGEDEKFRQYEELEKAVKEVNEKIKQLGEDKEKEINTI